MIYTPRRFDGVHVFGEIMSGLSLYTMICEENLFTYQLIVKPLYFIEPPACHKLLQKETFNYANIRDITLFSPLYSINMTKSVCMKSSML